MADDRIKGDRGMTSGGIRFPLSGHTPTPPAYQRTLLPHLANRPSSQRFNESSYPNPYPYPSPSLNTLDPPPALPLMHLLAGNKGEVAEWSIALHWKCSVPQGTEGSNPSLSAS